MSEHQGFSDFLNLRTDGRTDGRTLFYRSLLAEAWGLTKSWALEHPVSMSNSELIQKKSNKYDVLAPNDHDHETCTPVYSVT